MRDTEVIDEHVRHMTRRNLRPSTIQQRQYVLRRLKRFLGPRRSILAVTLPELRGFVDRPRERVGGPVGPAGRAAEITHLRGFYRWAHRESWIRQNPTQRLERPQIARRLPRPIPDHDLKRALELAPHHRIRPWLYLAAYAGLRACDIAPLEAENVFLENVPPMMLVFTKGGRFRAVPISTILAGVLDDSVLARSGWLFPRLDGHVGHVPPWLVSQASNHYLHGLGITHTLHTLRHWFGTQTYRQTRDLRVTQELLGHLSPAVTQLYTWIDPADGVAAVNRLPML